jgi:Ca-activated chloride channel family protein
MSQNDDDFDPFARLTAQPPAPNADAKKRALSASLLAFEEAQKKTSPSPQGNSLSARLMSIITSLKGKSIMDMRLPNGTAAVALLVLPLGYQLYSTTTMTQPQIVVRDTAVEVTPVPQAKQQVAESVVAEVAAPEVLADAQALAPAPQATSIGSNTSGQGMRVSSTSRAATVAVGVAPVPPAAAPSITQSHLAPAAPMPMAMEAAPSGDRFTSFAEQRLKAVSDEPVSTFSIDVDTASYSYVRAMLDDGFLPQPDAVRIEEMINYFPYAYPEAQSADVPFQPTIGVFPTPWNPKTQLLHIGIKGYVPPAEEAKPSNLVFLIDTSGSMYSADKLPLLKRAFALLVEQLSEKDSVAIVTYAGSAGVVLEPTKANEKAKILAALDQLSAGGGTAGAEGIALAYRLAEEARVDGTNRVILATDGDFNVGFSTAKELQDFIRIKRSGGTTLSVLGFGQGNLGDDVMQALAQTGNGNASYISSFREAQKVLVEEIGGTLDMIAKDVKIQVEFNPAQVSEYRLIGYETRALNREDFNNDAVDAGDIGAGTTVTAIYEITPAGSDGGLIDPLRYGSATPAASEAGDELAFLRMRYKLPNSEVSQLIEQAVTSDVVYGDIKDASDDMRFAAAVAAFGQKLKGSNYASNLSWADIEALARTGRGADENGYRIEFINLVKTASALKPDAR